MTSTSALPGTTILNLPIATSLNGADYFPVVQGGVTKRAAIQQVTQASTVTGQLITTGSAGTLGLYYGTGAPIVTAAQGSLYMRIDGSSSNTRLYVNTLGSSVWTNVITAT